MDLALDEPRPVRVGEELETTRLAEFLEAVLPGVRGPVTVAQFPHGYSNLTYLVRVGDQEFVLRRPPFGNRVKSAHDMGREYRILSRLSQVYELAPRPVAFCDDASVLGEPFYLMERRRGVILRGWSRRDLPPELVRRLCEALIDAMARLHQIDYAQASLGDLGRPEGYVERQVTGWTRRFHDAQTDDRPDLEAVAAWLAAHRPADAGPALVHNDFKFDNLVLDPEDPTRIVAVLDWEMATIGDPLMDLGTTLGYWVEAGDPEVLQDLVVGPTDLAGALTRRELIERYARAIGHEVSDMLFYYVFGLFKIAVIAQQIYARFLRGTTRDERFGRLNTVIAALGRVAAGAIEAGRYEAR
ncbi:MAG: phosphotransferase family protein [Isosphaeraceae bacterium]|nr:phosphotransferase family protein [Isosphaeraceae bacterium]